MSSRILLPEIEVSKNLKKRFNRIESKKVTANDILYFVCHFCIVDPVNCGQFPEYYADDSFLNYLHENHRLINRQLYEKIPRELFPVLRKVIGDVTEREYAQDLLANFFVTNPLKAHWI